TDHAGFDTAGGVAQQASAKAARLIVRMGGKAEQARHLLVSPFTLKECSSCVSCRTRIVPLSAAAGDFCEGFARFSLPADWHNASLRALGGRRHPHQPQDWTRLAWSHARRVQGGHTETLRRDGRRDRPD